MNLSNTTPKQYNDDSSLHGSYQYVTLDEVVNNFLLAYTGDENIIKQVAPWKVLYHARRGLQELSYDVLKDVRALEVVVNPETLSVVLPQGFVDYVRISEVDDRGHFVPLFKNNRTALAENYLQDHEYNILFDGNGEILLDNENTYDPFSAGENSLEVARRYLRYDQYAQDAGGGAYWLDAGTANFNDWFTIYKGVLKVSSLVGGRSLVIEYLSDGLDYADPSQIVVHKYAEEALLAWINWKILGNMDGVPRNLVQEKAREYEAARANAGIRRMDLDPAELYQTMRIRRNHLI